MPLFAGMVARNEVNAARPPEDAPIPTIRPASSLFRLFDLRGAALPRIRLKSDLSVGPEPASSVAILCHYFRTTGHLHGGSTGETPGGPASPRPDGPFVCNCGGYSKFHAHLQRSIAESLTTYAARFRDIRGEACAA